MDKQDVYPLFVQISPTPKGQANFFLNPGRCRKSLECSYFLINCPKEANKLIRVELQYGSCIHANIICMFFVYAKIRFFFKL